MVVWEVAVTTVSVRPTENANKSLGSPIRVGRAIGCSVGNALEDLRVFPSSFFCHRAIKAISLQHALQWSFQCSLTRDIISSTLKRQFTGSAKVDDCDNITLFRVTTMVDHVMANKVDKFSL